MSNKSQGTAFEREFAEKLADYGFWAHCMKDNQNGQPFDVIAARDGNTYVFDCKDCQSNLFRLSRVEENQHNAMKLWRETGNKPGLFAVRMREEVYLICHDVLVYIEKQGKTSMSHDDVVSIGYPFDHWLDMRLSKCR